jgi:hypothetical protein
MADAEFWIARDEMGHLRVFINKKPYYEPSEYGCGFWRVCDEYQKYFVGSLSKDFFPDITTENSPQRFILRRK